MKLYCGIDLHSNNDWLTLINEHDERLVEQRLVNDLSVTLAVLAPYREALEAIRFKCAYCRSRASQLDDFPDHAN